MLTSGFFNKQERTAGILNARGILTPGIFPEDTGRCFNEEEFRGHNLEPIET